MDGSRNKKGGAGKRVAELGRGGGIGDVLETAQRKKILKELWGELEGGGLSAREKLSYMQEISRLEAFQKERDNSALYEVVLKVGGVRVRCGGCGNVLVVQELEGERCVVDGGEVL